MGDSNTDHATFDRMGPHDFWGRWVLLSLQVRRCLVG